MKIQWWQDGLHVRPSTAEEREALAMLYRVLHLTDLVDEVMASPSGAIDGYDEDTVV